MLSRREAEQQVLSLHTFAGSQMFMHVFNEGMRLIEDTAQYLDGPGRCEQNNLPGKMALLYAGESMRVTTRLMQVASWLLVQRAVHDGDMAPQEATASRYRLGPRAVCLSHSEDENIRALPENLQRLLNHSLTLYRRIARLDDTLFGRVEQLSGARARIAMLQRAFPGGCA